MSCKKDSHLLFGCKSFIALLPDKRMNLVRDSHLCINYLKSGHFAKQCPSSQKCKKYRGSHHSLLQKDSTKKPSTSSQSSQSSQTQEDAKVVTTHTSQLGCQRQMLLMTCQVIAVGPDDIFYKGRALLDSGSSASFISEQVALYLHLPH